ncbi:hypothetical protein FB451DRAFT_1397911 [Mycena latifolia]|nr:hypothetical protein FB451DRAFT_1397911 [Mycena latifolia]
MNPVQLPELLCEIATYLTDPGDIIHLSQCAQFTHEMVLPSLFQYIDIHIASVSPLAAVLRKNPTLAKTCRSLAFCKAKGYDIYAEDEGRKTEARCLTGGFSSHFMLISGSSSAR